MMGILREILRLRRAVTSVWLSGITTEARTQYLTISRITEKNGKKNPEDRLVLLEKDLVNYETYAGFFAFIIIAKIRFLAE